jgi:hypothetical protein
MYGSLVFGENDYESIFELNHLHPIAQLFDHPFHSEVEQKRLVSLIQVSNK